MNNTALRDPAKRSPWLAALLSFIMPGVGQVYCGRLLRGLALGLAYGLAIPVMLGLLAYAGPASTILFGSLAVIAVVGVMIAAVVDAWRLAVRTRSDYELKAFNCPGVYLLIGLMIQGSSIGYGLHVRASFFEAFRVSAASMYPTIAINDRILGDKTAYRKADPKRGDLVLFHPPSGEWRMTYIKRVVAIGGDTVQMTGGELYVNGQKLPREPVADQAAAVDDAGKAVKGTIYREHNTNTDYEVFIAADAPEPAANFGEVKVPEHHCFVLGDNRSYSLDSRQFGPVPYAMIIGRADYLYWPAGSWSHFGRLN
ncbi:MAG: signal peptidase I [Planctomycetes bacterium RBG_13_60_9]|nr:MAG: signal peptidase I [Planctomycetes bacterium RBG_13_60_9]